MGMEKYRQRFYDNMFKPECKSKLVVLHKLNGDTIVEKFSDHGTSYDLRNYVYDNKASSDNPCPVFNAKATPDHFRGHQGKRVPDQLTESSSSMDLEPLTQLYGKKWGPEALSIVHSLRPSCIRVGDIQTLDCWNDRVSVTLEDDNETIRSITMEVSVYLPDHIEDGHEMQCWMDDDDE